VGVARKGRIQIALPGAAIAIDQSGAFEVPPRLEDMHPEAGRGKLGCDQRSRHTGTHYHDIDRGVPRGIGIGHVGISLSPGEVTRIQTRHRTA